MFWQTHGYVVSLKLATPHFEHFLVKMWCKCKRGKVEEWKPLNLNLGDQKHIVVKFMVSRNVKNNVTH